MMECEICMEEKPCGMIRAYRWFNGQWEQTVSVVSCADCAGSVGGIAAGSVQSWIGKEQKVKSGDRK